MDNTFIINYFVNILSNNHPDWLCAYMIAWNMTEGTSNQRLVSVSFFPPPGYVQWITAFLFVSVLPQACTSARTMTRPQSVFAAWASGSRTTWWSSSPELLWSSPATHPRPSPRWSRPAARDRAAPASKGGSVGFSYSSSSRRIDQVPGPREAFDLNLGRLQHPRCLVWKIMDHTFGWVCCLFGGNTWIRLQSVVSLENCVRLDCSGVRPSEHQSWLSIINVCLGARSETVWHWTLSWPPVWKTHLALRFNLFYFPTFFFFFRQCFFFLNFSHYWIDYLLLGVQKEQFDHCHPVFTVVVYTGKERPQMKMYEHSSLCATRHKIFSPRTDKMHIRHHIHKTTTTKYLCTSAQLSDAFGWDESSRFYTAAWRKCRVMAFSTLHWD